MTDTPETVPTPEEVRVLARRLDRFTRVTVCGLAATMLRTLSARVAELEARDEAAEAEPDPVKAAIIHTWGERCSDHAPGCQICDAWVAHDAMVRRDDVAGLAEIFARALVNAAIEPVTLSQQVAMLPLQEAGPDTPLRKATRYLEALTKETSHER